MHAELIALRLVHVVGGVLWVGFAAYNTFFVIPTLTELGPAGGPVMAGLQKRKMLVVLPALAIITILAGLRLMMVVSANNGPGYFQSRMGQTFGAGAVLAIIATVLGFGIVRPSMDKVGKLGAERAGASPDRQKAIDAEMGRLRARAQWSGNLSTWLLLATAVAMAVARYI